MYHAILPTFRFLKKAYLYSSYVTSDDVVEVKGKVACEISSADELTLTELMFSGTLKDATVEQMVALLSCFVWQEKLQDAPKPREELDLLFYQLQETARRVANLQLECKVTNTSKLSYHMPVLFFVKDIWACSVVYKLDRDTEM